MASRPNPITTLVLALISIACWILTVWQWFDHNDHWALFWLCWCLSFGNAANMRLLRYRGVIR